MIECTDETVQRHLDNILGKLKSALYPLQVAPIASSILDVESKIKEEKDIKSEINIDTTAAVEIKTE